MRRAAEALSGRTRDTVDESLANAEPTLPSISALTGPHGFSGNRFVNPEANPYSLNLTATLCENCMP